MQSFRSGLLFFAALLVFNIFGASHLTGDGCASPVKKLRARIRYALYEPYFSDLSSPRRPDIRIMSEGQIGFTDASVIDGLKRKMLAKQYDYEDSEYPVSGTYHSDSGTFFVMEGHRRIAATLEIARESGDWSYFKKLVSTGVWEKVEEPPSRPTMLPVRSTLWNSMQWKSFLAPFKPPASAIRRRYP